VTPEEVDAYYAVHCAFCHKKVPIPFRIHCAECGHTWRWGWQLSLHDTRRYWEMTRGGWRWWQVLERFSPRRPSNIWVCPCCSHDL
jgi:hypothetical protein